MIQSRARSSRWRFEPGIDMYGALLMNERVLMLEMERQAGGSNGFGFLFFSRGAFAKYSQSVPIETETSPFEK